MTNDNTGKNKRSIARLKMAFVVSLAGLRDAWRGEQAFRLEVIVTIVATPLAFLIPVSLPVKLILIGSLFLVLAVELLNSAIEAVVDLVTRERHPLAKNAKDMGSAAVLVCIVLAVIAWSVTLIPWLIDYLP